MTDTDRIEEKLDEVLANQLVSKHIHEELLRRLTELENNFGEMNRTVRGFNGTPGLVTEVGVIKERVDHLSIECSEKKKIGKDASLDKAEDNVITFKWIVSELAMPLALGFAAYLLFNLVPQIIGHFGGG
jgi:hypothetical protein